MKINAYSTQDVAANLQQHVVPTATPAVANAAPRSAGTAASDAASAVVSISPAAMALLQSERSKIASGGLTAEVAAPGPMPGV